MTDHNGARVLMDTLKTPYCSPDGEVPGLVVISRDITERKRVERELRESDIPYRSVFTAMVEGVVVQNSNNVITAVNPAAEKIPGLPAAELMGQTSEDRIRNAGIIREDGSAFPAELHPSMVTLRTGEPHTDVTMGIHRPDGTLSWISVNSQPLLADGETPYAVVSTFHEITRPKQTEHENLAHLMFLESMDRVNRAIQDTCDLEQTMSDVPDVILSILGCDRAYPMYPCEPVAESWVIPMGRKTPDYPGAKALGVDISKNAELQRTIRIFFGRELRMVELKERIKELEGQTRVPQGEDGA